MSLTPALWTWSSGLPVSFGNDSNNIPKQTKSGVAPADIANVAGVNLVYNSATPTPMSNALLLSLIRSAEDEIETTLGMFLCPTRVAAPAILHNFGVVGTIVNNIPQTLGVDYDVADAGYDFVYDRWWGGSWGAMQLRYRPIQRIESFFLVYPLLNMVSQIPLPWFDEILDKPTGLVRTVPSTNIQLLPLFSNMIAVLGPGQSIPGALRFQYVAGFTDGEISGQYSFLKQLVIYKTVIMALGIAQGSISKGFKTLDVTVDGMRRAVGYSEKGPYYGLIQEFRATARTLEQKAEDLVGGPIMEFI